MSEFEVTIERHGYNAATHQYRVHKRFGAESIDAGIEALRTHERHGCFTYPADGELTITVKEIRRREVQP